MAELSIGTAGWSIALANKESFPEAGASLERYAARFRCAEINSSFHRSHRLVTWGRWHDLVPEDFRFSAKLSKEITHKRKLVDCEELLGPALEEMEILRDKLAIILVQLPPSLAFDRAVVEPFFAAMRERSGRRIACEPRHASWFDEVANRLLERLEVARVAADPARVEAAAAPGGWRGFSYWRLHGSPVPYRSSYSEETIQGYAAAIAADLKAGRDCWCIFDNTASSAATGNALRLLEVAGRQVGDLHNPRSS